MKISTQAGKLKNALTHTGLVTTKQSNLSALEGVYLEVGGTGGVLRATNLQVGVEASFPATVEKDGVCMFDPQILLGVVSSLDATAKIELALEENLLHITTPTSHSTLKTLAHEDFPTLPKVQGGESVSLPITELLSGWQSVVYAASQSDIKPEISSIYLYTKEGSLFNVSTDSFRLAEKKVNLIDNQTIDGVLIPVKNIQHLIRVLSDEEGDVEIHFSPSQMSFQTKNRYCVTRLVDGSYPNYEQIVPTEFSTTTTLLKSDLVAALKTLNIFTDTFHQVDITIDPQEKKVVMTSQHPERGQHTTHLEAVIEGEDLHVRCNAKYVQDCLGSITTDSVQLQFVASNKPFILRPIGDASFQYLVMPLNR